MPTLNTSDQRMLELIEILKEVDQIDYATEFCLIAGVRKENIRAVRNGKTGFRAVSVERVCRHFDVDANFVMGFQNQVFRGKKNSAAVNRLISELRKSKKSATPAAR